MILVTLGTQDKQFTRLLDCVEEAIEKGIIQEEVIAQIGQTPYQSRNMKCFSFLDSADFDAYLEKARVVISHGGVGTISKAVSLLKPVIACPRLEKYGAHHNDHQIQIIEKLSEAGSLIPMWKTEDLENCLKQAQDFFPRPIESNNEHFRSVIKNYIDSL